MAYGRHAQPEVLSSSESVVYSDGWGQASIAPQFPASWGTLRVEVQASIAGQTIEFTLHTLGGTSANGPSGQRALQRTQ